jgi:hypothetical protein
MWTLISAPYPNLLPGPLPAFRWADLASCFLAWSILISLPRLAVSAARCHSPIKLPANATEQDRKNLQEYVALVGAFGSKEQKDRDPFELANKIPVEEVPMLFIVCGGEDGNAEDTHAFLAVLAKRRIPYEYREISPRAHDWRIWNEEIPVFLDKLDHVAGFGAALPEAQRDHSAP